MDAQVIDHARVTETDEHYHVGVSVNKAALQEVLIAIAIQAGSAAIGHLARKVRLRRT